MYEEYEARARTLTLENGAAVTLHYRKNGETLAGLMAEVLAGRLSSPSAPGGAYDLCAKKREG